MTQKISLGERAADTEVGRVIDDDVVGLIPRGYRALKNKLFRRKTNPIPVQSYQPVQSYKPVQTLSPEGEPYDYRLQINYGRFK